MPINRSEFDEGQTEDSEPKRILQLLNNNSSMAYSAVEIALTIGAVDRFPDKGTFLDQMGWYIQFNNFTMRLNRLVAEGAIQSKRVTGRSGKGESYYSSGGW